MKLVIDKRSAVPVYRQIIGQITSMVQDGKCRTGDRLPSERELAQQLNVARGTIARAYRELTRNRILDAAPGSRRRISSQQDVMHGNRKERALHLMRTMLQEVQDLRFSLQEIGTLFHLVLLEQESNQQPLCLALVDCNPETLSYFRRQLSFISRVQITRLLLEDILDDPNCGQRLEAFDLVVTTSTHWHELRGRCPEAAERVIKVSVSPSQQTIIDLATLGGDLRIGLLCESRQFRTMIEIKLRELAIGARSVDALTLPDDEALPEFIARHDVLIMPPGYSLTVDRPTTAAMQSFRQRGGKVISFEYQIERGSFAYIEECVRNLLEARQKERQ